MTDPRIATWARTLVGYSVAVKPGQTVAIQGGVAAEPLLRAIYRETIARDAHPTMLPLFSGLGAELLRHGTDAQLDHLDPVERWVREGVDVSIRVMAETNTKALSAVEPARQARFQQARTGLMEAFMGRAASGALDWTLTLFPTDAYAQDADMATDDFAEFVYAACKLDRPDPVAAWREQAAEQERLIAWLAGKREIRLRGLDTDLTVSIVGRRWINADGTKNFPDGEIFTGPVEDGVDGHVRFSYPVVTAGREVHDVRLRFHGGRVVDASAAKNEAFLIQTLDTDAGARTLGEFAFGTNFGIDRFTKNILFDEKIGGTVHMAVGAGYPETGSVNRSAVHWDLICDLRDGGAIDVDGEPFLRDGRYVV
ncbi:MAG: Aminopeptidase [uncultured Thermomicrobiales bacterium]|uniref:Aminopeptidase n=1 Tax=uncultured Thermomicrobiales bacterium TaxID=1645740 RepID=A0A6J4V568_9BACT|nr:MAG: Aminopeptidase [uncultured Thermomicrobiales bacterium]